MIVIVLAALDSTKTKSTALLVKQVLEVTKYSIETHRFYQKRGQ